jgi:hypothetical protein
LDDGDDAAPVEHVDNHDGKNFGRRNAGRNGAADSREEESGLEEESGTEKSRADLGAGDNKEADDVSDAPRPSQYQDLADQMEQDLNKQPSQLAVDDASDSDEDEGIMTMRSDASAGASARRAGMHLDTVKKSAPGDANK